MYFYKRHTDENITAYSESWLDDGNYDTEYKKSHSYLGGLFKKQYSYSRKVTLKKDSKGSAGFRK